VGERKEHIALTLVLQVQQNGSMQIEALRKQEKHVARMLNLQKAAAAALTAGTAESSDRDQYSGANISST
jgi:hypothetical protein